MKNITDPAAYEAWYLTPRGHWIGDREFILLQSLLSADEGSSMLDVGCGTGHFSRRFSRLGVLVQRKFASMLAWQMTGRCLC